MKYTLFCFFALLQLGVFAQSKDLAKELNEVVVSDQRHELPYPTVNKAIVIITKAEIQKMPAQNVAEVLQYALGVDVRQRGPFGVQSDISIRGGSFDQVLIMINGVRLIDPQTGHHSMNIPVDLESVERIEIIRGAGALAYGANGLAGAINIVTKAPKKDYVRLGYAGGDFGFNQQQISIANGRKKQRNYISFRRETSTGYRPNTGFFAHNLFAQSQIPIGKQSLQLMGGNTYRNFGANGFYGSPQQEPQHEENAASFASANMSFDIKKVTLRPRIYWRRGFDFYKYDKVSNLYNNRHISQQGGAELNGIYKINDKWQVGFGTDVNHLAIFSNNLGDHQRTTITTFGDVRWTIKKFNINFGLSSAHFSDVGRFNFATVDFGYAFNKAWRVYSTIGNTYRIPTYTDRFYNDPSNIGNPNLTPESALNYDFGFRRIGEGLLLEGAFFVRVSDNLIDWTRTSDTLPWRAQNIGSFSINGIEASVGLPVSQLIDRKKFLLHNLRVNYAYLQISNLNVDAITTRYQQNQLRHNLQATADFRLPLGLNAQVRYRFAQRENMTLFENGYQTLDARLLLDWKILQGFIEGMNLSSTQYWEVNQIPMPGRYIRGGVNIKIGRLLNN